MKVKTENVRVTIKMDKNKFQKEFQKAYEKALSECIDGEKPEVHITSTEWGGTVTHHAILIWFVE